MNMERVNRQPCMCDICKRRNYKILTTDTIYDLFKVTMDDKTANLCEDCIENFGEYAFNVLENRGEAPWMHG